MPTNNFTIYVDGPALIYIGAASCTASAYAAPSSNELELGYTENGAQISVQTLTHRVNSDDCGGAEGNPAEILAMGAQGNIRGSMVKYNPSAWVDLINGLYGLGEAGLTALPGTPIFQSNLGVGFWIIGVNGSYYFPRCEMTQPREFNISATERRTSFSATAYPVQYVSGEGSSAVCNNRLFFPGPGQPTVNCGSCVSFNGT